MYILFDYVTFTFILQILRLALLSVSATMLMTTLHILMMLSVFLMSASVYLMLVLMAGRSSHNPHYNPALLHQVDNLPHLLHQGDRGRHHQLPQLL